MAFFFFDKRKLNGAVKKLSFFTAPFLGDRKKFTYIG